MTQMRRTILTLAATAIMCICAVSAAAQDNNGQKDQPIDWHDRIKAEKIAFLTDAIGLTSEEAEKFWPVYNKCEAEKKEAFKATFAAFKELNEAIKSGKDDKTVSKLLDKYLDCQTREKEIDRKYLAEYGRILSSTKVAKLFIGEERFRRQQIYRLKENGPAKQGR